jgi:predicted CoA-binding protein
MPHPLDSFFAPASIALVGASRDHEKIPGRLLAMLRKNEYPGHIYPVNPNDAEIDGLVCYKSVADIGAPIDLAVIIIPARAVLAALEQCAAVGVKNAVIISSGFAAEGGGSAAMQDAIADLAGRTGMRISGPNAEGFLSQVQRVAATFSPAVDVKPGVVPLVATTRRIGIVAQSGGIGFAYYHRPLKISALPPSSDVGLLACLFRIGKGIEIDELRIVPISLGLQAAAAMNVHQGLHAPRIEIVHMLVPQRDRQQRRRQFDQREGRRRAPLVAVLPLERIERVDQLPLDLRKLRPRRLRRRRHRDVGVADPRARRERPQLPADEIRSRQHLPTHLLYAGAEAGRLHHGHCAFSDRIDQPGRAGNKSRDGQIDCRRERLDAIRNQLAVLLRDGVGQTALGQDDLLVDLSEGRAECPGAILDGAQLGLRALKLGMAGAGHRQPLGSDTVFRKHRFGEFQPIGQLLPLRLLALQRIPEALDRTERTLE